MSLRIDFDVLWDPQAEVQVENAIRACVTDPGEGESWTALVTSFDSFCTILVRATQQTRRKLFLLPASELAEAIPEWLQQYPLR